MRFFEAKDDKDHFVFLLHLEDETIIKIYIYKNGRGWVWDYQIKTQFWYDIRIKNNVFYPIDLDARFDEKKEQKINQGFYELLKIVKNHPEYRLKILNVLDDEIRKIWNQV